MVADKYSNLMNIRHDKKGVKISKKRASENYSIKFKFEYILSCLFFEFKSSIDLKKLRQKHLAISRRKIKPNHNQIFSI